MAIKGRGSKGWFILEIVSFDVEYSALEKLVELNEKTLNALESEMTEEILNKRREIKDKDELGSYDFHVVDPVLDEFTTIRNLQRAGQFLTLYAFFEGSIRSLAEYLVKDLKPSLSYSDLKGSDIEKFWVFFKKVLEVDVSTLETPYGAIRRYLLLRNSLAHLGSKYEGQQKLYDQRTQFPDGGLYFNEYEKSVSIEESIIFSDFLSNVKLFMHGIMDLVSLKYYPNDEQKPKNELT